MHGYSRKLRLILIAGEELHDLHALHIGCPLVNELMGLQTQYLMMLFDGMHVTWLYAIDVL